MTRHIVSVIKENHLVRQQGWPMIKSQSDIVTGTNKNIFVAAQIILFLK
jgi:hypothetical protein